MELRDYGAALRRHWKAAVGLTLACVLAAVVVVLATPATYRATAQVFVASAGEGTSGSQFVNQRVKTYPDVARSREVLGPVIDDLGLPESFAELRDRVEATNPPDTSQIDIAVTGGDAEGAAEVADAVAEEFGVVVERLESPQGVPSPVDLTVTNPATVPTRADSPAPELLLPLGLVVGLALGAAAAVVRSRLSTTLHTADDVRAAWGGPAEEVPVLVQPRGRAGRSALVGAPAALLARRLELMAEERPVHVHLLSPSPNPALTPGWFADDVARELRAAGVSTTVAGRADEPAAATGDGARVRLSLGSPLAPVRTWRRVAGTTDGVVLVIPPGRVERAELVEVRSILSGAGIRPLALVLSAVGRRKAAPGSRPAAAAPAAASIPTQPTGSDPATQPLKTAR